MLKEYQGILQMILWVLQHLWNGKIIWKTQLPKPIQKETENLDMSIECKEVKCIIKDISQRKLSDFTAEYYWNFEEEILQILNKLRK